MERIFKLHEFSLFFVKMTSETADIKIQNVSNDVVGIGNTIVEKINNYFNSDCIDNDELNRLKSLITLRDATDYGTDPEDKRRVIIEALLNLDILIPGKEIVKTGLIKTFPAMSYKISTDAFALGSNYEKHDYSNYSQIHILPSVTEITTGMFANNKATSSYIFYKPVKLNPGCFSTSSGLKSVVFNFSHAVRESINGFISLNEDVVVFDEIQKNITIALQPNHEDLRSSLNKIFNMLITNDTPIGGGGNNNNNNNNPFFPGGL